jgi:hypothetical protein
LGRALVESTVFGVRLMLEPRDICAALFVEAPFDSLGFALAQGREASTCATEAESRAPSPESRVL